MTLQNDPGARPQPTVLKSDVDALRQDLDALRKDLSRLAQDARKVAGEELRKTADRAGAEFEKLGERTGEWSEDARRRASETRDLVEDRIREHPFAAIGIALAAGFLVAAISRRR
jgi:ElaB/YqjD/DUF883 family membrane-anchored ribosome-binding protein